MKGENPISELIGPSRRLSVTEVSHNGEEGTVSASVRNKRWS